MLDDALFVVHCRPMRWNSHRAELADHLLPDGLEEFVTSRRAAGQSWRRIALELRDATGTVIDVTHETLRSWFTREPVG